MLFKAETGYSDILAENQRLFTERPDDSRIVATYHDPDTGTAVGQRLYSDDPVTPANPIVHDMWLDSGVNKGSVDWIHLTGVVLGHGTSKLDSHLHPIGAVTERGRGCSGCRWSEATVILATGGSEDQYLIHSTGRTVLEGEETRYKLVWTTDPGSVLKSLLVHPRPRGPFGDPNGRRDVMELQPHSREALTQVAMIDEAVADIWETWMTVTDGTHRIRKSML